MASSFNNDNDEIISAINVTPLVDIVLVLLIIFMVTAKLMLAPSVNVNLPKVNAGDVTQESALTITMSKDQKIFVNDEEVPMDAIIGKVTAILATRSNVHAIVSADKEVSHGDFMKVVDAVQTAGVTKFSINVDVEK